MLQVLSPREKQAERMGLQVWKDTPPDCRSHASLGHGCDAPKDGCFIEVLGTSTAEERVGVKEAAGIEAAT